MSYRTIEVEIDHGAVAPIDGSKLPDKAKGLLTVIPNGDKLVFPGKKVSTPRPSGLAKGEFTVPDDFNTALPDDVIRAFEGK